MAISLLRGRAARQPVENESGIAIGETDEIVASCPACGRPLDGAAMTVCPGCGTRLLLGVPARKAGTFAIFGAVVGLLAGGMLMGTVATMARPATVPAVGSSGAAAGSGSSGSSTSNGQTRTTTIPSTSLAAVRQTVTINQRLLASVPALEKQVADKSPDAVAIAATLRGIAADAAAGSDITTRIVFWNDASDLRAALLSFYGSVRATAREGLAASVNNAKAYQAAAKRMLATLAGVAAIDAQTQQVAAESDVTVPTAVPGG